MADEQIQGAVIRHAVQDMADVRNASQRRITDRPRRSNRRPSTSSVLWAAWRQGLKDLQTVILGPLGGTHEEPGNIANPVQMEVYQDRHHEEPKQEMDTYREPRIETPRQNNASYEAMVGQYADQARDSRSEGLTR